MTPAKSGFRRWWCCGQADFCPLLPGEQAVFLLGGTHVKRLFLFDMPEAVFSARYLMGRLATAPLAFSAPFARFPNFSTPPSAFFHLVSQRLLPVLPISPAGISIGNTSFP
ncbi:MAG: hypothetical protein ACM3N4_01980 [Nitrososphaerota archaeon]